MWNKTGGSVIENYIEILQHLRKLTGIKLQCYVRQLNIAMLICKKPLVLFNIPVTLGNSQSSLNYIGVLEI